jgi:twitching motility protein PilJ
MGFASKMALGFANKNNERDDTVLAAPDTQFGADLHPAAPAAPVQDSSAEEAALRLGHLLRPGSRAAKAAASEDEDELRLPLIGHLSLPRQLRVLLMAAVAGILLIVVSLWQHAARNAVVSSQTQIASDALVHSQRVGRAAPNALRGNAEAFGEFQESQALLGRDLALLFRGGEYDGHTIPVPGGQLAAALKEVNAKWTASGNAAATILKMKPQLTLYARDLKQIELAAPRLQAALGELLAAQAQGGSPREVAALGRMMMLAERLSKNAGQFLAPDKLDPADATRLREDSAAFEANLDGVQNGNAALGLAALREPAQRARLEQARAAFQPTRDLVANVSANLDKFGAARAAASVIVNENESLRGRLTQLQKRYRNNEDEAGPWFTLLLVASVFTLATGGSISRVMLQDSRNRARGANVRRQEAEALRLLAQAKEEEAKATNDQNQGAILRLMNELQEVADGDLTVHATVSEDITGAIADSVNYTIEELRALVMRVITTAEQVTRASSGARQVSSELLAATEQQSREIKEASSTVLRMAGEITDVSTSANESALVARQSVAAAEQGATAVQNAIKGMIDIREQIQETSKRIKRLGESSQEIGEITELISDITEQTNVLALNAAIQAASAGEAGRGFSVVAEEVQRLAERSAQAAKQIGALVRTIQTDTHDAVAAMEKSTQGVVEGARLSDAAGAALADISRVSNRLAELIQGISFATELQATSANGVAHNMRHILSVTEHAQQGTEQTAQSISQLALLAQELKDSVSRFRVTAHAQA